MITIGSKRKYYFIVADMYKQLLDAFYTPEAQEFTLDDYFWWSEWIVCRIISNFNEGKEILADIEQEEASDETA